MDKFEVIFCVLTYKNSEDLIDFLEGINRLNIKHKTIVVNNYADEESSVKINEIASSNQCVFLESENKGYGHGNNIAISYAKKNYKFDFLVVCNPDTIINKFDMSDLYKYNNSIIAPRIISVDGKNQNPFYFNYLPFVERTVYYGFKNNMKLFLIIAFFFESMNRWLGNFIMSLKAVTRKNVYACHGSFIIFSESALENLTPIFDNNLFLFSEEYDLAKKVNNTNIDIVYDKNIVIHHKEDGSINLSNINLNKINKESYLYYFEKWSSK